MHADGVLFSLVGTSGEKEGLRKCNASEIYRVECASRYLQTIPHDETIFATEETEDQAENVPQGRENMIDETVIGTMMQFHVDEGDPETFVVGCLVGVNTQWFLIQSVSPVGRWDGLALYRHSDLVSTNPEEAYLEKLQFLLDYRKEQPPAVPNLGEDLLLTLLQYAQKTGKPVCFELYFSGQRDVYGVVADISEAMVSLCQLDEYGKTDGATMISTDAITRVFYDDEELECLGILSKG